jgi:protein-tyrosine phosphatase
MQDFGLDLGNHESSNVSSRLMERADIILTMTEGHRRALIERWPKAAGKIKVLSADGDDISDPFGGPVEVYRICAQQLDRCLDAWVDRIKDEMLPDWQS